MQEIVATLERQREELLATLLQSSGLQQQQQIVARLKRVLEELELAAAAAAPVGSAASLSADFFVVFLLVELLAGDLNNARFLWKRVDAETKNASEVLGAVWEIGKALWKRNLVAAYAAMNKPWPEQVAPLVELLRQLTRESAAELVSLAYSTIAFEDVMQALGFQLEGEMIQYCVARGWGVDEAEKLVRPKPLPRARTRLTGIDQLDSLSASVLQLEQNTIVKLP